ncbi:RnfABCDGE type electron transport complex subunit B [Piscinibacter sakaiensis]|uniref:RnfABCDGE type electron transport complex subunit B n=1 Tax=Piscinibacter sakaiensis TaxID=1547922 RepID=UPI003AAE01E2
MTAARPALTDDAVRRIDAALPQTQCTRCGEPDCLAYAKAIVDGAPINRCPPGGEQGIARLAALTGRPVVSLDPECGSEGPRTLAWIDESACIGCTLCIKACPVDCIVGAAKRMHTVIESLCTGCELCLPVCPVDCIHLDVATPGRSGWDAWSDQQAQQSRERYRQRTARIEFEAAEESQRLAAKAAAPAAPTDAASPPDAMRQQAIAQALARARERRRP